MAFATESFPVQASGKGCYQFGTAFGEPVRLGAERGKNGILAGELGGLQQQGRETEGNP